MKQEFLQLAHNYKSSKHGIGGWWMSEKLDGMRAFWDGGLTTGLPKIDVPWANLIGDHRLKNPEICSGLWSRYGNVIHAPLDWVASLPHCPIDGELWIDEGDHQQVMKAAKDIVPGSEWEHLQLFAFDIPSYSEVLADREIKVINFKKDLVGCIQWAIDRDKELVTRYYSSRSFRSCYQELCEFQSIVLVPHVQLELPFKTSQAESMLDSFTTDIIKQHGEGAIVRNPNSSWLPERTHNLLKVKPYLDAEGVVIKFVAGNGKLRGLIGAVLLEFNGIYFELAGSHFKQKEITLDPKGTIWAFNNEGEEVPEGFNGVYIKRGDRLTFKYRTLSNDGVPIEARYWRKYVQIN